MVRKRVKKAIALLKKQATVKKRKILCPHPADKREIIHVKQSSTTMERCILCGKKIGRVVLPTRAKPGIDEQRLVAEAKKNPARKRRD